jgi:hypothetical protein
LVLDVFYERFEGEGFWLELATDAGVWIAIHHVDDFKAEFYDAFDLSVVIAINLQKQRLKRLHNYHQFLLLHKSILSISNFPQEYLQNYENLFDVNSSWIALWL